MANELVPKSGKAAAKVLVMGTGVFWGTGLVNGLIGSMSFLAMEIPVLGLTLGQALSAGIAASVTQFLVNKYMK